jgi:hypothetical protein
MIVLAKLVHKFEGPAARTTVDLAFMTSPEGSGIPVRALQALRGATPGRAGSAAKEVG